MNIPTVRNEDIPNKVQIKNKNSYECGITRQAQNHSFGKWYVDSGFSKHTEGNKDSFVSIEKDKGSVSFGNKNSTKVLGKGTVKLGSKNYLAENVLLVDNMKHNLLSVSHMCDQGHELIFQKDAK